MNQDLKKENGIGLSWTNSPKNGSYHYPVHGYIE
jgi:hypothetical protein